MISSDSHHFDIFQHPRCPSDRCSKTAVSSPCRCPNLSCSLTMYLLHQRFSPFVHSFILLTTVADLVSNKRRDDFIKSCRHLRRHSVATTCFGLESSWTSPTYVARLSLHVDNKRITTLRVLPLARTKKSLEGALLAVEDSSLVVLLTFADTFIVSQICVSSECGAGDISSQHPQRQAHRHILPVLCQPPFQKEVPLFVRFSKLGTRVYNFRSRGAYEIGDDVGRSGESPSRMLLR